MNKPESDTLLSALLSAKFTAETLPEITNARQREVYQQAADLLEVREFPPSQPFDRHKWADWLRTPDGMLCTALEEAILQWDDAQAVKPD